MKKILKSILLHSNFIQINYKMLIYFVKEMVAYIFSLNWYILVRFCVMSQQIFHDGTRVSPISKSITLDKMVFSSLAGPLQKRIHIYSRKADLKQIKFTGIH